MGLTPVDGVDLMGLLRLWDLLNLTAFLTFVVVDFI
jgi:hypothetical protein